MTGLNGEHSTYIHSQPGNATLQLANLTEHVKYDYGTF